MSLRSSLSPALRAAVILTGLAIGSTTRASTGEHLVVVQNGEKIGSLEATTSGKTVSLEYIVNDNGRGPKHKVTVEIGADDVPVSWSVRGTSLMGGSVDERFSWKSGRASWASQADSGDVPAARPPLYVHRELELYTMAGMSPAEALRAGTWDAAEYLKQGHDTGSIERGKFADFFLIAGDPTKDIKAVKSVRLVFKGGAIYKPAEIYKALSIRPFATSPPMTVPAVSKDTGSEANQAYFSQNDDEHQHDH